MRIIISVLFILASIQISFARSMVDQESMALNKGLEQFIVDLKEANGAGMVKIIPPKLLSLIAGKAGLEEDVLKESIKGQMKKVMSQAVFHEMTYDLSADEINDVELSNGEKIAYSIIPIAFTMTVQDTKMKMNQPMFALWENEQWYFVRLEQPAQIQMLGEIYPFVKNLTLPESKSQVIQ